MSSFVCSCIFVLHFTTYYHSNIEYFGEPWFQDGVIAQAVNDIVREKEITYFSSAGNAGKRSWQGPYKAGPSCYEGALSCHDFGNNTYKQRIKWSAANPGQYAELVLQWDESDPDIVSGGSPNDLDVYLFDTITGEELDMYDDINVGGFACEFVFLEDGKEYDLAIGHITGPPPHLMKWKINFQEGEIEANPIAKSSTIVGHANAKYAAAVGAASERQTFGELKLESFSSPGGTPITINRKGKRFKAQKIWNQPRFVSADGSINSFYGAKRASGGARFYGTSAAAPNAAGIALLMKQAAPNLSPSQIYKIMENTAIDMNEP
jgi:subtilisin family serine protease